MRRLCRWRIRSRCLQELQASHHSIIPFLLSRSSMDLDPRIIFRDDSDYEEDLFRQKEATMEFTVYLVDASPKMFSAAGTHEEGQNGETFLHAAVQCKHLRVSQDSDHRQILRRNRDLFLQHQGEEEHSRSFMSLMLRKEEEHQLSLLYIDQCYVFSGLQLHFMVVPIALLN